MVQMERTKGCGESFCQSNLANLQQAYCQARHASLSCLPSLWLSEPENNGKEICTESYILQNRLYSPLTEITTLLILGFLHIFVAKAPICLL